MVASYCGWKCVPGQSWEFVCAQPSREECKRLLLRYVEGHSSAIYAVLPEGQRPNLLVPADQPLMIRAAGLSASGW